jgi:poly(3-hydroxybutyrate) depolymerase
MARDGADGKTIRDLTGLDAAADRERFLVAYPDGLDGRWNTVLCCNDSDDVGFVRALVDHARRRWGADPTGSTPPAPPDDPMSAPDTPISASDLLWKFLEQHPRRR